MIRNGNFTEGWTDLPPAGTLINQEPTGWNLEWIEPGEPLYGDEGAMAQGIPECVHKLSDQLPPNEKLGGSDALILAGGATYKVFHATSPFGVTLSQTVTGLEPGSQATLTVPVQVHLHGETDPFGAESGAWVNGEGEWANAQTMGDREWYRHQVTFTVPDDGRADIVIRFKSKWARPKDFFIDNVTLEAVPDGGPGTDPGASGGAEPGTGGGTDPGTGGQPPANTVRVSLPAGLRLVRATSDEPGVVTIIVPEGVAIES